MTTRGRRVRRPIVPTRMRPTKEKRNEVCDPCEGGIAMRLYLTGHMTHTMLRGAAALATLALVITSAPDADATVTLTTPGVQANGAQVSSCDIINIGKTAITLTVGLFNM